MLVGLNSNASSFTIRGLRLHVLCYVFRVPPPSFVEDLDIQGVSLKVVTWSDFWPAAGENFGILDHQTLSKCVVFVAQTVEYEPKVLKNFASRRQKHPK